MSGAVSLSSSGQGSRLQRLLFSATLTDNPRKLSLTGIRNPLVIRTSRLPTSVTLSQTVDTIPTSTTTTTLPTTLTENICVCKTSRRPLVLLSILLDACGRGGVDQTQSKTTPSYVNCCAAADDIILIFASSVESTHRLCRLIQIFNQQLSPSSTQGEGQVNDTQKPSLLLRGQVREITRLVRAEDRAEALQIARGVSSALVKSDWGRVKVLVASDQLARGIDLKNIRLVINYDPPVHARTYVHRVGRTARAQRVGHCITILKHGQEGDFKKMRGSVDSAADKVMREHRIEPPLSPGLKEQYSTALGKLGQVIHLEAEGSLKAGEC